MKNFLLTTIVFLNAMIFSASYVQAQNAMENKLNDNVNIVPLDYSYEEDFDSAKFRMNIYKMSQEQILSKLKSNPDNICKTARSSKDLFLSSENSSEYVVKVLKQAGAIDAEDKDYKFTSAHFMWDFYLAFRNFVEIDRSFEKSNIIEIFESLPNGTIVLLSKHCIPNGAVAISCDKKLYTKRFPNLKPFLEKVSTSNNEKCRIGNGIKFLVEAERFK